jgi:phenylalanyl-tRNA synthetase beta chain
VPVITLYRERFSKFMNKKITIDDLTKNLPWIGFDLEEITQDYVKAEYNPNRIDFCSYAGVARALKGFLELETGLPKYTANEPKTMLIIDKAVANIRPYMLAGVVRNIKLDEDAVVELMDIQEDLHWGIGRGRKKASIGIHNLDMVKSPFTFTAAEPISVKFVPLGKTEKMNLKEILQKHEKGMGYRHLVDWSPKYPLLIDKEGAVLSMPPIINGELTRVDANTRNLFLDVTGTSYEAVEQSLNVLTTALADMGGALEKVNVKYSDHTVVSPNLKPKKMELRIDYANELLGLTLSETETIKCLRKTRLDAQNAGKGVLGVMLPPYRIDILHEVDLVEEVALGYGYYRLKPTIPKAVTVGEQHPTHKLANSVRQIMIGLGFLETINFTLTNERIHYECMRTKPEKLIKLANPVSIEYAIMRQSLLPGLMKNLADSKSESFPQRLFEASDVGKINERIEAMCERRLHIAAVLSHSTANFTEIKSVAEAFLASLGLKSQIREAKHPSFLEGRTAAIIIKGKQLGILGEIHPQVLNNFELENPVAAFEMNIEKILKT